MYVSFTLDFFKYTSQLQRINYDWKPPEHRLSNIRMEIFQQPNRIEQFADPIRIKYTTFQTYQLHIYS